MAQKVYVIEGRQFRTEHDYRNALHDKELADKLRAQMKSASPAELERMLGDLRDGKYRFLTLIGQDLQDELGEEIRSREKRGAGRKKGGERRSQAAAGKNGKKAIPAAAQVKTQKRKGTDQELASLVREELDRQEKRRKRIIVFCSLLAVACLGYFGIYSYYDYRTRSSYEGMAQKREEAAKKNTAPEESGPLYILDDARETPEVLEEYKNLLNTNKKLIGWVKIDDTIIDYPVMQTSDNEYYLDHNLNQEYDKNGSIFMDKDCDVLKPSTNFILYGHHMQSGKMFGTLQKYSSEKYCKEHPYIEFDTIYEKGTYQVMYAFRSKVYSEEEIVFKYYQFIDANSEQEFDSYMREMAELSFYDTGVTASYGDQLLTLSTCDYEETNGRFVVVAKKVK